ncbi:MAG: glycosyltransferase family 4 protein [Syntrophaceae bacterium]|nr:glycosyltransferase family 4 protein [Syntrophaceae bacterium]
MKITILWASLASYTVAFFRELVLRNGCQLQLVYQPPRVNAPYNLFDLSFCEEALEDTIENRTSLGDRVNQFGPDVVLMSSWPYRHFMRLSRKLKKKGAYVISTMDNQYRGTLKQRIGIAIAPFFLKLSIDTFLVAGDRQAEFAKKLGYFDVMYGLYAAEVDRFITTISITQRPHSFLFAGRLIDVKNIKGLLEGYAYYRKKCSAPWDLKIVGTGPLEKVYARIPGVQMLGFVQPSDLPNMFEKGRCLILPSTFEPWGVVIHEAAAAALSIIATYPCGAVSWFVHDGVNGFVVPPHAEDIGKAMLRISQKTDDELMMMSRQSEILAGLWTPAKLAEYFVDSIRWRFRFKEGIKNQGIG